jgi:hypothetical protein
MKRFLKICMLALAVPGIAAAQTQTDIGQGTTAQAVAPGYVAGAQLSGDQWHAMLWSSATQSKTDVGAQIPGSGFSLVTSVNSHGQVVGGWRNPDYTAATAFYWSATDGLHNITTVGNFQESPILINESGTVAGIDINGHLFKWTLAGGLQDMGLPVANVTTSYDVNVTAINSRGDVIGNAFRGSNGGYALAFVAYASDSAVTVLHSPSPDWPYNPPPRAEIHMGDVNIQFNDINDNGVVVGTYWDFAYLYGGYDISQGGFFNGFIHNSHAFSWTPAGGFTDLGNLGSTNQTPSSPAAFAASASAINNGGTIVGNSSTSTGGFAAFSYGAATGMTQLPARYPGAWTFATGVNEAGTVVGSSDNAAIRWDNGVLNNVTPSFASMYPSAPIISGNMIAGNGYDSGWGQHAWSLAMPLPPPSTPTVFASGSASVMTWDPIFPPAAYSNWVSQCTAAPAVGPNANWVNPHAATSFPIGSHPWEFIAPFDFTANWINAWSDMQSRGPLGQSWTKYSTVVTGEGDFVVQFLADNCSWIYMDDQLVGVQDDRWNINGTGRYPVTLTGAGPHTLTFIILDGGGLAGGKFRLETRQSFIDGGGDTGGLTPTKQPTTTTVSFGVGPFVYTGSPFIATASVSPAGTATITYSGDCVNAGNTCTATAEYAGDSTHLASSATASITIDKAPTFTTVSFGQSSYVYSGSAITATASAGASIVYSGSCTNVGTCTATATTAGDANHTSSSATASASITPATATITATAYNVEYDAQAHTALFSIAGVNGETGATVGTVAHNTTHTNVGTYSDSWSFTGAGNYANIGSTSITNMIKDTTAPSISSVTTNAPSLWPPNHKMVAITVSASATDLVGVTSLKVISVTSNEPDNGLGDGDTAGDTSITGPLSVSVRAERSGKGNGRTYTITVEARDAAGNASVKTCTVFVPLNQGK